MENAVVYYMSIGYPIGLCKNEEDEKFFNVENNGEFCGLYNDSYLVWKYCFFDIKTKEDICKDLKMHEIGVACEISRLKNYGLLIEIESTKISDLYNLFKNFYVIKNGFGHGLTKDEMAANILNQGQIFTISLEDFCLWGICNNRNNIGQIVNWYKNKFKCTEDNAKKDVMNIIFRLKTIDLIRISK